MGAVWLAVVTVLLACSPASAQIHRLWTHQELDAESDLVVIASPLVTHVTPTRTELDGLQFPVPVVELNTNFQILSVVSGSVQGDRLTLRHYRHDWQQQRPSVDGGTLIEFGPDAPLTRVCRAGDVSPNLPTRCDYLLYLKREGDGFYRPTSGDLFPSSSVFLLRPTG